MFNASEVRVHIEALRSAVTDFEPGLFSGSDAAELVLLFEAGSRACDAGKALAAHRVEETKAYVSSGHRDASTWLASVTGESVSDARAELELTRRMENQPGVSHAVRSGELSSDQAVHISRAIEADPASEKRLLQQASNESFTALKAIRSGVKPLDS